MQLGKKWGELMPRPYATKLKKGKLGKKSNGVPETTDRGLYREEIKAMRSAPLSILRPHPTQSMLSKARRNELLLRLLWNTWARLDELLSVQIEHIDIAQRTILLTMTKRKVLRHGEPAVREERTVSFSEETKPKLVDFIGTRRKGSLFSINQRAARVLVNGYAMKLGIQTIVGYDANKRPRYLITPKAFREAGEAYAVMEGMDREMAAKRAGHTVAVQQRNYTKYDAIRARDIVDRLGVL